MVSFDDYSNQLQNQLQKAIGWTHLPDDLVGRKYCFVAEYGSHHQVLLGTILGLELSDEGGLELIVSNPRFGGAQLLSLSFDEDNAFDEDNPRWQAHCAPPKPDHLMEERDWDYYYASSQFFPGVLRILVPPGT